MFEAGYEIINGTAEEKIVREKIRELKDEANLIVKIWNKHCGYNCDKIDIPFPERESFR